MALAPLFVPTYAELVKKLRLTGVESGADAAAIIDEAIVDVRLQLISRLTQARITTILTTAYTSTPSTNEQFLRTLGSVVETKMVRLALLLTLPTAKMDASGDLLKRWNEEAPFREMGSDEIERMMTRLQNEIEEALELLAGEDTIGDDSSSQVWDGAPVTETPAIGDSLCRNLSHLLNSEF